MIELIEQRLEDAPQIGKIHHPTRILTYRTAYMNFNSERMPVHAGALVPVGDVGQAVGGFDLENAEYIHGRIVPPAECLRNWLARLEPHP